MRHFKTYDFLQLARDIRQTPSNLLTPILLITDKLKKSYRTAAQEAGVTDFLFQPLDAEELAAKIETIKKAGNVRHKVLGLSSRISAPKQEASSTFFKDKVVLHDQALQLLADAKKRGIGSKCSLYELIDLQKSKPNLEKQPRKKFCKTLENLLNESSGKIALSHLLPMDNSSYFCPKST